MDEAKTEALMLRIKSLVFEYGLEGTFEMIDYMPDDYFKDEMKNIFKTLYLEVK